jgi:hypothetical protein
MMVEPHRAVEAEAPIQVVVVAEQEVLDLMAALPPVPAVLDCNLQF